jgi:hypothetical protein
MFEQIEKLVETAKTENEKFSKGNKTAGTRLRKNLLEIKTLCHELRKEISEKKNDN